MGSVLFSFVIFNVIICRNIDLSSPLSTSGNRIVDVDGTPIKLSCVNWYGAEEKDFIVGGLEANSIANISNIIKNYEFNCVRLPFSLEMVEKNPIITNKTVISADMDLYGKTALEIFDVVVQTLESLNIYVILDNHMSDADWCCGEDDENGLWYNKRYSEEQWINDLLTMVQRYKSNKNVIGVDLRNELRKSCGFDDGNSKNSCRTPTWGSGNVLTDWKLASEKCAHAIQKTHPDLLIIIEGLQYATDLRGVRNYPIHLSVPNKLVYESHDYNWFHPLLVSCSQLEIELDSNWGFILEEGMEYTAPIWMGEFGTCHTEEECVESSGTMGLWFQCIKNYAIKKNISWAYWAIDGTQSRGRGRQFGAEETFGILNKKWNSVAMQSLIDNLKEMQ